MARGGTRTRGRCPEPIHLKYVSTLRPYPRLLLVEPLRHTAVARAGARVVLRVGERAVLALRDGRPLGFVGARCRRRRLGRRCRGRLRRGRCRSRGRGCCRGGRRSAALRAAALVHPSMATAGSPPTLGGSPILANHHRIRSGARRLVSRLRRRGSGLRVARALSLRLRLVDTTVATAGTPPTRRSRPSLQITVAASSAAWAAENARTATATASPANSFRIESLIGCPRGCLIWAPG